MKDKHSGDRLRQYIEDKNIKPAELAAQLKISAQRLNNWFKLGVAKGSLLPVSKKLNISAEWLELGIGNPEKKQEEATLAGYIDPWDSSTPVEDDEVEIPFFMEVELSAGHGSTQVMENSGPKLRFAKSTLRRAGVEPSQAACVKVSGNSMSPWLSDGVVVGINLGDTLIKEGATYAVDQEGMLKVKYLHRLPGGGIRFRSLNRDEYPDEDFDPDYTREHIRILGKVFWFSGLV